MCSSHVLTAVSYDRLPSLNRVPKVEATLRIIAPLIEQAQIRKEPQP
jgi:hypothetical protein